MLASNSGSRLPLWYHGWNIVAVCVLAQVAALGITLNCFSLFLLDWTHEFHAPVSAFAIAVTIFAIACMVTSPFVGALADRFPARWIFGVALIGLVVADVAISFAMARWQIVAIYALLLPIVIVLASSVTGQALVSRWFVRRVGLAMGLTAFGAALSGVVFPPIIVWLMPLVGWRWVWRLFAILIAVVFSPIILVTARDRPTERDGLSYVGTVRKGLAAPRLTIGEIVRRRNFWITIGVFVPVQSCFMAMTVNLAPLVASRGLTAENAGELLSLMSAAALIAKLIAGLLVDRFGNRIPLVLSGVLSAAGMVVLAIPDGRFPILAAGVVLVGCAGATWTLLASSTAAEFGSDGFGRAFGLISALTPLGTLAPPILARIEEATGSYAGGLIGIGLFALAGGCLGLLLREDRRGDRAIAADGITPPDAMQAI